MKKTHSLTALLSKVKDKRRKQGTRHSFENIYVIVILSTMNGYIGYRGMEDFMIRFKTELESILKSPTHGLPSYSSIRRVMQHTDFNIVSSIFNRWIRSQVKFKKREWAHADGKGIKGTVTNCDNKYQNFVSLVSLWVSRIGITIGEETMNNKKQSEIQTFQKLIEEIGISGLIITADAIHCQKKLQAKSSNLKMTMY